MRRAQHACTTEVISIAGAGVTTLGPSHRNSEVPITSVGRVTEQVVTVFPATMEKEREEVRVLVAGSIA